MLRNVAVLVWDGGAAPFEVGVLCEAFGVDRSDEGLPVLDFAVCGVEPGPIETSMGFSITRAAAWIGSPRPTWSPYPP